MIDARLQAIALLFGMEDALAQRWPGIHVVCSRLEARSEALLRDEFNVV